MQLKDKLATPIDTVRGGILQNMGIDCELLFVTR